jgi:hypothetical protein
MNEDFFELYADPGRIRPGAKRRSPRLRLTKAFRDDEAGFRCKHCQSFVSTASIFSGVQNRNHCPYCLWSRHVDLHQAGDRLAACKAQMQPVGLTLKKQRKKYGNDACGELMIVHLCTDCGRLSINRIAADDEPEALLKIFECSLELDLPALSHLEEDGIRALKAADADLVYARLFGLATA